MSKTEENEPELVENWRAQLITSVKVEAKGINEARRKMARMKISLESTGGVQLGKITSLGLDPVCPVCGETIHTANSHPRECHYCKAKLKYSHLEEQGDYFKTLAEGALLMPITEFGWKTQTVRALQRWWGGTIPTLGEVAILTDDELLCIRGFGYKCLAEVKEILQAIIQRSEGER